MVSSACMAFSPCPLLTQGAVRLLSSHGSAAQKRVYLSKLVSGGVGRHDEPDRSRRPAPTSARCARAASADGDHYRITGTEDLHHLWRARPGREHRAHGARARYLTRRPASRASRCSSCRSSCVGRRRRARRDRNDLRCVALEHKLGIHGSPTCRHGLWRRRWRHRLAGRRGEPRHRVHVHHDEQRAAVGGHRGLAIAERAYQQARDYATDRASRAARSMAPTRPQCRSSAIPTCGACCMTMRAQIEAMRALAAFVAGSVDRAKRHADAAERVRHQAMVGSADTGGEGLVHGHGMRRSLPRQSSFMAASGSSDRPGWPSIFRDARIAPIYEGRTASGDRPRHSQAGAR